ncbi:MAG: hypothetical protein IJC62_04295 [Clostridia bacterium]|nr:hypothetical protein [Clostridia bacterium]
MSSKKSRRRIMSDAELIELMRYAVLESGDFDLSDELEAAVYSTWYLMNPLSLDGRDKVGTVPPCRTALLGKKADNAIKFTAHAHECEPQKASPDDLIVYSLVKSDKDDCVNFITDRFSCKKIL